MSNRCNAMTTAYEEVTVLGKPALFTCLRIENSTVPSGYHLYEVRHDDDGRGDACQIAKNILVNHWGSLITREEITLPPDGYLDIKDTDINYCDGDCDSMKAYMKQYPPLLRVMMIEPKKAAYEASIGSSLKDMQEAVGGYIQAVYPFDEPVAIICNEEGKMMGLPLNRALRDDDGNIYDILVGTCFICGLGEDNFTSFPKEHTEKFKALFQEPEIFKRIAGEIHAIKTTEQAIQAQLLFENRNAPVR